MHVSVFERLKRYLEKADHPEAQCKDQPLTAWAPSPRATLNTMVNDQNRNHGNCNRCTSVCHRVEISEPLEADKDRPVGQVQGVGEAANIRNGCTANERRDEG